MAKRRNRGKQKVTKQHPMLFDETNYKLLGLGVVLIFVGFLAMYLENEVKGVISLYISPIIIMAGFVGVVYAVMRKPDHSKSANEPTA